MKERERFQVKFIKGETLEHAHVVDTQGDSERIVRFGDADRILSNQLFFDPAKAEKAARLLNSGASPEEINIHDL